MDRKFYILSLIFLISVFSFVSTSAQPFEIKQAVIATGGGTSSSGTGILKLDSTIGQPVATTNGSMGGLFNLRSGFIAPAPFAPTAAGASIRGRVLTRKNRGVRHAIVSIMGGNFTEPKIARTNQFGYFTIKDVEIGFFYIITVKHSRHRFIQNTHSFMLFSNVRGLVFHSDGEF